MDQNIKLRSQKNKDIIVHTLKAHYEHYENQEDDMIAFWLFFENLKHRIIYYLLKKFLLTIKIL